MLTSRGWWQLLPVLGLLGLGLGTGTTSLTLICFTLFGWFLASWIAFVVKVRWIQSSWVLERELRSDRGPVVSLWVRQKVQVSVRLACDSALSLPFVRLVDRLPELGQRLEGDNQVVGPLGPQQSVEIVYQLTCPSPGRLCFEGIQVQIADLQGFFQFTLFVRQPAVYWVYPVLVDLRGNLPTSKRFNVLPLLGTHRHRRPGSGSELLDLRDYLPGDPPKMIAWKASARRDRLMTKEFESEVPVRCTLFVDVSASVRVGRLGENMLARLLEIAAGVVQASADVKDLTGLCLFDEAGVRHMIQPARGSRHLLKVTRALATAADLPLTTEHASLQRLLPLAFGLAQEIYPDLLDAEINWFPFWLPLWSPQPGYTQSIPLRKGKTFWSRPWIWLTNQWRISENSRRQFFGARLSPRQWREYRWRKQLAALLAVRHDLGPGGLALLLEDDQLCRRHLQRFLAEHQVAAPLPLYDAQGRYLFAAPAKIDILVRALLTRLAHSRDNELFVLLVDLLEVGAKLEDLLHAVQVVRARHHKVMLICPWPREIPLPAREEVSRTGQRRNGLPEVPAGPTGVHPVLSDNSKSVPVLSLQDLFFQACTVQLQNSARQVQRAFARLGVSVLFAPQEETVSLILHHMYQLRLLERGVP